MSQVQSQVKVESTLSQSISEAAAARGITHLVHFTPIENIIGMLTLGALVPRRTLLEKAEGDNFTYLRDYLCLNDMMRYDYRTDCLNLSIQHPNSKLFYEFRRRHVQCDLWVVLMLWPSLLDLPGTVFTIGNAASKVVQRTGSGEGQEAFNKLFAKTVEVDREKRRYHTIREARNRGWACKGYQAIWVNRKRDLAACYPTDIQAEVLLPHEVPLEEIMAFAVENEEHAARLKAICQGSNYADTAERVVVNPTLFSSTRSL